MESHGKLQANHNSFRYRLMKKKHSLRINYITHQLCQFFKYTSLFWSKSRSKHHRSSNWRMRWTNAWQEGCSLTCMSTMQSQGCDKHSTFKKKGGSIPKQSTIMWLIRYCVWLAGRQSGFLSIPPLVHIPCLDESVWPGIGVQQADNTPVMKGSRRHSCQSQQIKDTVWLPTGHRWSWLLSCVWNGMKAGQEAWNVRNDNISDAI